MRLLKIDATSANYLVGSRHLQVNIEYPIGDTEWVFND